MKTIFKWLAPFYALGYVLISKSGDLEVLDNYILGGLVLFLIFVLYKLYLAFAITKKEDRNIELFHSIFALVVLLACLAVYWFY